MEFTEKLSLRGDKLHTGFYIFTKKHFITRLWHSMLILSSVFIIGWITIVFPVIFRWLSTIIVASKRMYINEFLNLGFTHVTHQGVLKPQCLICGEVSNNKSFKKNKLKRHLEGKHNGLVNKNRSFFFLKKGAATEGRDWMLLPTQQLLACNKQHLLYTW